MIATFSRFDLTNLATAQPRRVLIPLAFVIVFGVSVPVAGLPILMGGLVGALTASYPFQADERGLLDTLYATAPLSRRTVVIGRYLSALAFGAVAIALGVATTFVIGAIRNQGVGGPHIALMLLLAFGILSVALSVQLPWFFALGFTRGRPMVYIPVAVITVIGWIAGQTGLLDGTTTAGMSASPSPGVAVVVVALGAALLVLSATIATRLYRRREL